ncbi:hypothetical protein GCM10020367_20350 [Streptomyces sannanensis]|uniref:Zinc ribbon domain-containing protein n=1 Tax=Streptomyces sannanensis TaxID=285536 RepID=A0ABP6S9F2_9ACTN
MGFILPGTADMERSLTFRTRSSPVGTLQVHVWRIGSDHMDYCHLCRRHLNGALACPGCGTPAAELRRHEPAEPPVYAAPEAGGEGPSGPRRAHRAESVSSAEEGGAAGRSRRARKGRTRTVVIVSVGAVLAVGALGLTRLTAGAPQGEAAPPVQEGPVPEETPWPEASSDLPAEPTGLPATEQPSSASAGASESAEASESPSPTVPFSPSAVAPYAWSSAPARQPTTDGESPAPRRPSSEPPVSGTPQEEPLPTASPSPSATCTKFLWWCT